MKYTPFGISNIAWPAEALDEALGMLPGIGCTSVEIAPFNVFNRWNDIADDAKRLRDTIERHGLVCRALQGILYGMPDVALFASETSRLRLERHLADIAVLAGWLGAKACVFGAPKQRDPGDLPMDEAWDIAVETLRRVGPAFAAQGTALAFEANARQYGCRFIVTTAEAARLVAEVDRPGIRLQIDTGTLFLEAEPPGILNRAAPLAVHAHISEPNLQPLGRVDHAPIAKALRESGYAGSLSVEMKQAETWRDTVPAAAAFVQATYA